EFRDHLDRHTIAGGLQWLKNVMTVRHIGWLDVGDEDAYRSAVIARSGYDWTKVGQATYMTSDRVVKFFEDPLVIAQLSTRFASLRKSIAPVTGMGRSMFSQLRIPGPNLFEAVTAGTLSVTDAV